MDGPGCFCRGPLARTSKVGKIAGARSLDVYLQEVRGEKGALEELRRLGHDLLKESAYFLHLILDDTSTLLPMTPESICRTAFMRELGRLIVTPPFFVLGD